VSGAPENVTERPGDNRPARYEEPDSRGGVRVVYRASALGHCANELAQMREGMTGEPPPTWMLQRYEQGHDLEPVIFAHLDPTQPWVNVDIPLVPLPKNGRDGNQYAVTVELEYSQDEMLLEIDATGGVFVRGHIDGAGLVSSIGPAGIMTGQPAVIEVKALGPSYWSAFKKNGLAGLPETYAWQLSCYMLDSGRPALLVCGKKNEAMDDIEELLVEWIPTPPKSMAAIQARIMMIERGLVKACKKAHYPCSMYWVPGNLCNRETREEIEETRVAEVAVEISKGTTAILVDKMKAWETAKSAERGCRKLLDDAEKARKNIEQEVAEFIKLNELPIARFQDFDGGDWQVEWIEGEKRAGYKVEDGVRSYLKVTPPKRASEKPTSKTPKNPDDPFVGLT
jgi:hypothetical protein